MPLASHIKTNPNATPKTQARGTATRTANKIKRKERILTCAGKLIATKGYDAFTLAQLAADAGVTIPTIHNLLGKKSQIIEVLVDDVVSRIGEVLSRQSQADPIAAIHVFTDELMSLYAQDEALYKAAFLAGERAELFEHSSPQGIFMRSLTLAINLCQDAAAKGYLNGDIETPILAEQLFGTQRLARQDWIHNYIDIPSYKTRILIGMFTALAADAAPDFKARLMKEIGVLTPVKA
ncbi:MAG: TetR/AcrR family transcriptional regulator [Maricaulaceae bacterium]